MPCQTQTSQQPQQPTTVLPQNLPQTQADWSRFLQRMNELLGSINNAQYATGVNAVPTQYAVYDGTGLPPLRVTGATSSFDTTHEQFGAGSLKLTATASIVTVELAVSGYPITLHPNWKWIASLFLLTSAASIAGKLSMVTPAQQYDVDISGSPGASWSRLYGDYDLTADASTSCTLLLTLTGVTVGQVFNLEGWMLEPSQGAVLPSPFIMTSGPRTWAQVVNDGNKPQDGADVTANNISADTAHVGGVVSATVNNNISTAQQSANIANGSLSVINPNFLHDSSGWSFNPAPGFTQASGTGSPNPFGNTYLTHFGQAGQAYATATNGALIPVGPGQVMTAVVALKDLGSNVGAYAASGIQWWDVSGNYITASAAGYPTCGPAGTYEQCNSKATGAAPANAAFASVYIQYFNHTSGTINATCARLEAQLTNQDELPDGLAFYRSMAATSNASAWEIDNAQMQSALVAGAVPGWSPTNANAGLRYSSSSPAPATGAQYLVLSTTSSGGGSAISRKQFNVRAGDSLSILAVLYAFSGTYSTAQIDFYTSAGSLINSIAAGSSSGTWSVAEASGIVPSNASYATLSLNVFGASSATFFNGVVVTVNDVRVAGSGAQVGDQRNLKQRTITNYPSKVSPGISYSASAGTPATATISVAAFTALLGSVSVSYNAASASVTGTNGTNVSYYLYFNDPGYSGGTHTLVATTNQNDLYSGDGYVYVGYVTVAFPSSGSGSGGGTGCPLRTAWVIRRGRRGRPQFVRAGKVRVGDWLLRTDGEWAEVTFSRPELQPCVRLVADGFGTLGCSVSAPMQLRKGFALSIDCLDREVVARAAGVCGHVAVTALRNLGDQWVQHITLVNAPDDFFWTGDAKDALFGHHNAKPP